MKCHVAARQSPVEENIVRACVHSASRAPFNHTRIVDASCLWLWRRNFNEFAVPYLFAAFATRIRRQKKIQTQVNLSKLYQFVCGVLSCTRMRTAHAFFTQLNAWKRLQAIIIHIKSEYIPHSRLQYVCNLQCCSRCLALFIAYNVLDFHFYFYYCSSLIHIQCLCCVYARARVRSAWCTLRTPLA